ncbi:ubiquitin-domain-containing protein [Artemisia annua]|uniref:Ubiquitin-domain-containing protein n=1 Tax=Artemisia annua TaxID=35608 RepID=A0A2U1PGD4_ARTAN|nr:ubiquitin-domain-containing protein [Artemisia annua]
MRGQMLRINVMLTPTGNTIRLEVDSQLTTNKVKAKIQDQEGIPAHLQTLFLLQKQLEDGSTLADYFIRKRLMTRMRPSHPVKRGSSLLGSSNEAIYPVLTGQGDTLIFSTTWLGLLDEARLLKFMAYPNTPKSFANLSNAISINVTL